jgi:hypothetical protein
MFVCTLKLEMNISVIGLHLEVLNFTTVAGKSEWYPAACFYGTTFTVDPLGTVCKAKPAQIGIMMPLAACSMIPQTCLEVVHPSIFIGFFFFCFSLLYFPSFFPFSLPSRSHVSVFVYFLIFVSLSLCSSSPSIAVIPPLTQPHVQDSLPLVLLLKSVLLWEGLEY